jgi:hypothetical protein
MRPARSVMIHRVAAKTRGTAAANAPKCKGKIAGSMMQASSNGNSYRPNRPAETRPAITAKTAPVVIVRS